ncbi:uncharacterized protein LOC144065901 isoform X7 [Stigmatopora argus]
MPARTKPTEFQEEHSTVCNVTHEKVVIHIPEGFRNQPPQFEGEEPEFPQDQKREEQLEIKMEEEDVPWSTGEESFKIEEDLGRASGGAEPANTSAWPQIKEEADLPQQQKREDQPPIEKEEDVTWSSDRLDAHSCWTKSASGVSLVWHQHGGSTHPEWSIQFLRREML